MRRRSVCEVESALRKCGAEKLPTGKWVSKFPRMCSDKQLKTLYEFEGVKFLYKLINDDVCCMVYGSAIKRGEKFVKLSGIYIDLTGSAR